MNKHSPLEEYYNDQQHSMDDTPRRKWKNLLDEYLFATVQLMQDYEVFEVPPNIIITDQLQFQNKSLPNSAIAGLWEDNISSIRGNKIIIGTDASKDQDKCTIAAINMKSGDSVAKIELFYILCYNLNNY